MNRWLGRQGSLVGFLGALALAGCGGISKTDSRGSGTREEGGAGGLAGTGGAPSKSCANSLDCGGAGVCGPEKVCVDCMAAADCPDDHSCVDHECRPHCDSDLDCVGSGLLCDRASGYCVECLGHGDCRAEQHCASGSCRADVCPGGSSICRDGAVVECREAGDAFGTPGACGSRQTCVESGGEASCTDWRCTAGAVECAGKEVVSCSADGLAVESVVTCGAEQVCASGACQDTACVPLTRFCKTEGVYQCAADGRSSTLVTGCGGGQYCDDAASPACRAWKCTPNQPACDGNTARTCNGSGSGFLAGGTNCTGLRKTCSAGSCVAGGPGAACVGTPVPCAALGATDCALASGCAHAAACNSTFCASAQDDVTTCIGLMGYGQCSFDNSRPAGNQCFAAACAGGTDEASCAAIPGCAFSGGCSGTPSDCATLGRTACRNQIGCSWE